MNKIKPPKKKKKKKCDGLDVVGNVMTGVFDGVMTKGADDVVAGMAV